jgi:hypothetical protein
MTLDEFIKKNQIKTEPMSGMSPGDHHPPYHPNPGPNLAKNVGRGVNRGGQHQSGPSPYTEASAEITAKDLARQNRFRVSIFPPTGSADKYIDMFVENASFPGQNLRTTPDALRYGPQREIVHGVTYGPINLTFMCRPGLPEKKFFEAWHDLTFDRESWNVKYYQDYVGSIKMWQIDREEKDRYMVELFEVYPKTIISQDYNLGSNDTYQTLQVEFQYHHWESTVMPGSGMGYIRQLQFPAVGSAGASIAQLTGEMLRPASDMESIKAQVGDTIQAALAHLDHKTPGGNPHLDGVVKGEASFVYDAMKKALGMAAGGISAREALMFGASEAIGQLAGKRGLGNNKNTSFQVPGANSWLGSGSLTPGELAVNLMNAAYRSVPKTTANAGVASLFNIAASQIETRISSMTPKMLLQTWSPPSDTNRR